MKVSLHTNVLLGLIINDDEAQRTLTVEILSQPDRNRK